MSTLKKFKCKRTVIELWATEQQRYCALWFTSLAGVRTRVRTEEGAYFTMNHNLNYSTRMAGPRVNLRKRK